MMDQRPVTHGYPVSGLLETVDVLDRVDSALSRAS